MILDTTSRSSAIRTRQTLVRTIDKVRLLADREPALLAALDGFLGAALQIRDNAEAHNILLSMLETGADLPEVVARHEA